jgi:N,N-dimethylformamidase
MLIGFVSDEMYVAIADASVEFHDPETGTRISTRSSASGAVVADLEFGKYKVYLAHRDFGSKISEIEITPSMTPHQFRLLSKALVGYVWPKWVRSGSASELRFSSHEPVEISLYRYGWEKIFIKDIGRFEAFAPLGDTQTLPDGDISLLGVDWNHSRFDFPPDLEARSVIAPEESGLYYFHMKSKSGESFSFPWIVAPAIEAKKKDIAVLTSNICWNAYNDWGGRSNYVAANTLPSAPTISSTQTSPWFRPTGAFWWVGNEFDPISFDRPEPVNSDRLDEKITDPIDKIGAEHVAAGEWRLLGWLEEEGYEYDLYAENQFNDGELNLADYKVLILSTHPEYWTIKMYETLKNWVRNDGGKLLYLGGNGINCSVELHGDAMTVYNMDLSDWLPHRAYSGEGALIPSRFGLRHEVESSLLGVVMSFAGMGTGAPYEVIESSHPFFNGTSLNNGDRFGFNSLVSRCPGGASGHETDKRDASTPAEAILLARGLNGERAGAEMITYSTQSGGLVFSVGSVNWTASLPVDQQVSRITQNVLDIALE